MSFATPGYWKPRAYEPSRAPSLGELLAFLGALRPLASRSTYGLFDDLARQPAVDRVAGAFQTVISLLHDNPHLVENRDNTEVFARVLTTEEYASFYEIAGLAGLLHAHKSTAESLLCLQDRSTLAHFLCKTFSALKHQPYIHPLEDL